jgi:arylsulfatase A-like enzyme
MPLLRLLLLALLAAAGSLPLAAADRPNVVVFLSDDQGWGDFSLHGNPNLETPNLDGLARAGARFERFYVCPVCSPTRAEFLTGRYHPRTGVRGVSTGQERLNTDEKTLADTFKAAGYATGAFGKWHNGSQWPYHPNARGFDEYYGFTSGHWGEYIDPPLERNGRPVRGRGYTTEDFTDRALEFIDRNRRRPFLCYVPYNVPHSPFIVPKGDWERFRERPITRRGREGEREDVAVTRAALAMVENMDRNIGRVLRRLDERDLARNTIVLFFNDNGPNSERWNGDLKGRKASVDEGGLRSPLFVRWPGRIREGMVVPNVAGAIDLLPTLCGLTGARRVGDKPLDGRDLSALLLGPPPAAWPERLLFSSFGPRVSARDSRYRMDDRGALFDLEADPGQRVDVAAREPEVAARMRNAIADWRRDVLGGDRPRPDDRPFPVGHRRFPVTPLPARDGVPLGGIRRSAAAPNCSYFVNWTRPEDAVTWDIEVETAGRYEVVLQYTCPAADVGASLELSFGDSRLTGKVGPAWDPPLITDQDVIPRPRGESIMKDFRPLKLGVIRLERGRGPLRLRAVDIPGKTVMDLRGLTLTLL